MVGFMLRPTTVPRNTYINIKEEGFFTVNHIHKDMTELAHQTAAKFEENISEFHQTRLLEEYLVGFYSPYVKQSVVKMGCRYLNEYNITENNTILVAAAIGHLYFEEGIQMPDGWLRLEDAETVAINGGLDGYALPVLLDRFHYARPDKAIKSYFTNEKTDKNY